MLYAGKVYVFGGKEKLSTAEKYLIEGVAWRRVKESMLSPRHSFTPCVFKNLIYLCNLAPGKRCFEVFAPQPETYRSFNTYLAAGLCQSSLAFSTNEGIVILSTGKEVRWNPRTDCISSRNRNIDTTSVCKGGPVQVSGKVYWSFSKHQGINIYDLRTGEMEETYFVSADHSEEL